MSGPNLATIHKPPSFEDNLYHTTDIIRIFTLSPTNTTEQTFVTIDALVTLIDAAFLLVREIINVLKIRSNNHAI
jgi:hypothetical protein